MKKEEASISIDSNSSGDDAYAYHLINLFAGAIKGLNGGCLPLPTHWRKYLEEMLKFHKVGAPPSGEKKQKNIQMAKAVLEKRLNPSNKRLSLKEEYQGRRHDSTNIHRDIRPIMHEAVCIIWKEQEDEKRNQKYQERIELMRPIKERVAQGESLEDIRQDETITTDQYLRIRQHLDHNTPLEGWPPEKYNISEKEKAIMWISDGMNRHIMPPDYEEVFSNPDMNIKKAAYPKKHST